MKRFGWLLIAARKPVESILFIFSVCLMGYSLYVMSPWYDPGFPTTLTATPPNRVTEFVVASLFLLSSLPGLVAPFVEKPRQLYLKLASFGMFLSFLFLTILRLVIYGPIPVTWVHLIGVSLTCGLLRLYLEVRKD